ncbi:MAG: hypothetical protein OEM24_00875 [Paracoccaceae bacterium]|nr:hypothetical protein [Paracoccaceae bacterium]
MISGTCGQPLALTYSLSLPVDQVPAAPLQAGFVRVEPFYLEFTLSRPERVVLRTETTDDVIDPVLTLMDSSGAVIDSDDDGAGGYNSLLDRSLEPGSYCAQVRPLGGDVAYEQAVTLVLATGAAAEELAGRIDRPAGPGDLCTDPALTADLDRMLAPGLGSYGIQASVDPQSHRDWRLTVTEAMELQVDATSGQFDTMLMLVDEAGQVVAENDDGFTSGTDSRIALAIEPGSYCLSLSGFDGESGLAEIAMTDTPEAPIAGPLAEACTDPALSADLGRSLSPGLGSHSVSAMVGPQSRSDWRFEVSEEVLLQFDAMSDEFDTLMSLVDSSGTLIEQNDDEPNSINSRIVRTLAPGSYCLTVEAFGGGGGNFEIAVTDAPGEMSPASGAGGFCAVPETTADLGRDFEPGFGSFSMPAELAGAPRQDYRLTVTGSVAMRFEARSSDFDTVLRLATPDGPVLAENDDGPAGGTDSSFDYALAAGDYCLSLEAFAGGGGGAELTFSEIDEATLAAEAVARGESIPGPDSGVEIEALGTLADRLETNHVSEDLTKWVGFEVAGEGGVRIDAISLGGGFALRLFTEAGEMVDEAYSGGGISPARIEQRLPAGRYILAVALDPYVTSRLRSIVITRAGG